MYIVLRYKCGNLKKDKYNSKINKNMIYFLF